MQIRITSQKVEEISQIPLLTLYLQEDNCHTFSAEKFNLFDKAVPGSRAISIHFCNAMVGKYNPYHHLNIKGPMKLDM